MQSTRLAIILTITAFMLSATAVLAQGRGWAKGPRYDPATEATMKGVVEEVQQPTGKTGWAGVHLLLRTGAETIAVHLGPAAFISGKQFSFAKGDEVEIVGSRVTYNSKPVIIAREVTKEGRTLVLRDNKGFPAWSGGRRWQQ